MSAYVTDTYSLLREKADKSLAAKIGRDASFPRGPAGRAVVLTHMRESGFTPEQVEKVSDLLTAEGVK